MRVARADRGQTLGATAGLAVAVAFAAFGVYSGGNVPAVGLPAVVAATLLVSVVPGWIIGPRLRGSLPSTVLGTFAYAFLATFIWVPVAAIGTTVMDAATTWNAAHPFDLLASVAGRLATGYLWSTFLWLFAMPFAVVWILAYRMLGRVVSS